LTLYTSNSVISYKISSGDCKEKETDKKQLQEGCTMLKRLTEAKPWLEEAKPWLEEAKPWLEEAKPWLEEAKPKAKGMARGGKAMASMGIAMASMGKAKAREGKAMAKGGVGARRGKAMAGRDLAKAIGSFASNPSPQNPLKEATFPLQIIPLSGIKGSHGSSDNRIWTDYLTSLSSSLCGRALLGPQERCFSLSLSLFLSLWPSPFGSTEEVLNSLSLFLSLCGRAHLGPHERGFSLSLPVSVAEPIWVHRRGDSLSLFLSAVAEAFAILGWGPQ
jgi:hypothetical protein